MNISEIKTCFPKRKWYSDSTMKTVALLYSIPFLFNAILFILCR